MNRNQKTYQFRIDCGRIVLKRNGIAENVPFLIDHADRTVLIPPRLDRLSYGLIYQAVSRQLPGVEFNETILTVGKAKVA